MSLDVENEVWGTLSGPASLVFSKHVRSNITFLLYSIQIERENYEHSR